MNSTGVLEFAAKNKVQILDLRFVDLPGIWQHVSVPISELEQDSFKDGFGFDASVPGPVPRRPNTGNDRGCRRSTQPETVWARSARGREARRGLPGEIRYRGYGLLRR